MNLLTSVLSNINLNHVLKRIEIKLTFVISFKENLLVRSTYARVTYL